MPNVLRGMVVVFVLTALGLGLWVTGLVAVAQYTEDLCFGDLAEHPNHSVYRATSDPWPASYECQLLSNSAEPIVVQHRVVAVTKSTAVFLVPVAYVSIVVSILVWRRRETPLGEPLMSDSELTVFVSAFESSGFTGGVNWYRNLDRNWHLLADVNPVIEHPALMIYGERDVIPRSETLSEFVPNVEEISLDCGHWLQQEKPNETNEAILEWLEQQGAT